MPVLVVICDLAMPAMTGIEVGRAVKEICEENGIRKPAFIILTGWPDQMDSEAPLSESGIDHVMQKPVGIPQLLEAIQQTVESRPRD